MKSFFLTIAFFIFFLRIASALPDPKEILQKFYEDGVVAYQEERYQDSISLMQKALEIYPNFPAAYNYIGLSRKGLKQDIKEIQWAFKKAIELNPNYAPAYENLAKVHYELAQFDEAEKFGLKAAAIDPESLSGNLALGWIYLLGKSQPRDAVYYFKKAVANQDLPFAYLGLGMAHFMAGEDFKALEMITFLRKRGNEDFAMELERMVRDKLYIPPIQGWSNPQAEAQGKSEAQQEVLPAVPVRLRAKLNTASQREPLIQEEPDPSDEAMEEEKAATSKDRLRQLQKKRVSEYMRDY